MANHLPEYKIGISVLTSASPTATVEATSAGNTTIVDFSPANKSAQTTTIAERDKTTEFTNKSTDVTANAVLTTETELVHSTTPSYTSALQMILGELTVSTQTTQSWSQKSTSPPPVPTSDNRNEALCNCSSEGSQDPDDCDRTTGQCVCMPGYTGLQCDRCEDNHFTNGSTGCLPCSCDSFGSANLTCDSGGVCACKAGVYGDKCDDCHPGFFYFSNTGCQPCQCHNHSSYCHPQSGICLNCQGNTKGPVCEECKYNFYRSPSAALTEPCVPCPCSSVTSTGSCSIDVSGRPVCDLCKPEYRGPHCDECADGFYNSDSICLPCNCSGKADFAAAPRACHPDTGRCLSCVDHTAGPHCERCAEGYVRNASDSCVPTVAKFLPVPDLWTPTRATLSTAAPNAGAMTSNSTGQLTTTAQALLTSLGNPADNTTVAGARVSWTEFNIIVLAVIIVVVVVLMGVAGGIYTYREYQNRKLNAPFWTIELKEDNISFSSYHDSLPSADVSGLLEDEASEVASNGQLALSSPANMYKA